MQWQPLEVRCGWGRPAEECGEVSQGPLCWIWVPRGLEPEQRASCELCVGNSGGENPNAQPGNVPSKYMEQNPYRENKYCTDSHTRMLACLFLCNGVASLHQSNLCTWRFMLMHRSLQSMSEGMVIWFLIVFNSYMPGFWKYSAVEIRHETVTKRLCVCVHVSVCPCVSIHCSWFCRIWGCLVRDSECHKFLCPHNKPVVYHSHIWKLFSHRDPLSFSLSLLPSFLWLTISVPCSVSSSVCGPHPQITHQRQI